MSRVSAILSQLEKTELLEEQSMKDALTKLLYARSLVLDCCVATIFFCRPHYGKHVICRVQIFLPSAKFRSLGKDLLCRAPHSAKYGTRQRGLCRVSGTRQRPALGKGCLCRGRHSAKIGRGLTASSGVLFAECPPFGTRQRIYFAECQP